jgi:hypothetical protein
VKHMEKDEYVLAEPLIKRMHRSMQSVYTQGRIDTGWCDKCNQFKELR